METHSQGEKSLVFFLGKRGGGGGGGKLVFSKKSGKGLEGEERGFDLRFFFFFNNGRKPRVILGKGQR